MSNSCFFIALKVVFKIRSATDLNLLLTPLTHFTVTKHFVNTKQLQLTEYPKPNSLFERFLNTIMRISVGRNAIKFFRRVGDGSEMKKSASSNTPVLFNRRLLDLRKYGQSAILLF